MSAVTVAPMRRVSQAPSYDQGDRGEDAEGDHGAGSLPRGGLPASAPRAATCRVTSITAPSAFSGGGNEEQASA